MNFIENKDLDLVSCISARYYNGLDMHKDSLSAVYANKTGNVRVT